MFLVFFEEISIYFLSKEHSKNYGDPITNTDIKKNLGLGFNPNIKSVAYLTNKITPKYIKI